MIEVTTASFGSMDNNSYIITDVQSGLSAIIDCPESSEAMKKFIAGSNIQMILLTHGHFDHIGGVKMVKELTGASVYITNADAPMLSSSKLSLAAFCGAEHNNTTADTIISDGDVIRLGNTEIKVLETPGHTSGSVCFLCENYIFTGDTLFNCSIGRTDFPSGSITQMSESLTRLSKLDDELIVCPGHDSCSTMAFEKKNNFEMNRLIR